MEQSGPRHEEESFLIAGNRSWFRACFDFLFSLIFWAYGLAVVFFFVSATFGLHNGLITILHASFHTADQDVRHLVMLAFGIFLLFYAILYINRVYNKKRFGILQRRTYPPAVDNLELKSLGLMDPEIIEKLQTNDYIVFETNPITPLDRKKP
ncbi:hypothetical protein CDO73_00825 [Saccharibacillus sp. O23]|uniref:hypothetical protein n=1 Tax=Saccharibacillus sp. O23 TaxID=2009338 RepID=UPI000B4E03E5|nr:hypothetical protein [Saccharibacillus sp. O23]OWR33084.1 hypothetical protein CDO73_00825 [Saccharibacillus sp. O23]